MESKQPVFKVVLIGDKSVGKTSLVRRLIDNHFSLMTESTIGTQFCSKVVTVCSGEALVEIKLQIWDTAGEEKFRSVTPLYYKNSAAVLIVYDVTD